MATSTENGIHIFTFGAFSEDFALFGVFTEKLIVPFPFFTEICRFVI